MPEIPADVPPGVLVWLAIAGAVIGLLATAVGTRLPLIGEGLAKFSESRRRTAAAVDDADIAERDRQIAYLQGRMDEQRAEIQSRDELVIAHQLWDRDRLVAQPDAPKPPPLWPAKTLPETRE